MKKDGSIGNTLRMEHGPGPNEFARPRFRTNYNYVFSDQDKEVVPDEPSETVPDMSLSVEEILRRFTSNTLPPISKDYYYDEDADFETFDPTDDGSFDLADATNMLGDIHRSKVSRDASDGDDKKAKAPFEEQQLFNDDGTPRGESAAHDDVK